MSVTRQDVQSAVRDLGLAGQPLCVHSSLRSFGWVEGGAMAVVEVLLAEGCTLLVPTFSSWFSTLAPPGRRIARNGWDYDAPARPWWEQERIYSPELTEVEEGMGAIPAVVTRLSGRARGDHPLYSFAAAGPDAWALIAGQQRLDVFAPLRSLAELDGWVVLMGVGLNRMTLLHLAEQMAGRTLFRRWARGRDGQVVEVEGGGCSTGFGRLELAMAALMRGRRVGASVWKLFPARQTLEVAAEAIRNDPWLTHCGNPNCDRCADAVLGGPILVETTGQEEHA